MNRSIMQPTPDTLRAAAAALRAGEAVVMPTETVYGLACDARNPEAVARVFALKRRPPENPLIVHLADSGHLDQAAARWPREAEVLAAAFWPGPLTLVLPKRSDLPVITTGGLDTVAVRVPSHEVALALIGESGCAVAAPSANFFGELSPTTADAVDPELAAGTYCVLDGGQCRVGLESTVLDLTGDAPHVLRPGGVTRAQIEAALERRLGDVPYTRERRSPGMYARHYAPRARVVLVEALAPGVPGLGFGKARPGQICMATDPAPYAAQLYAALRSLDQAGVSEIHVERPPAGPEWEAIHDRLVKASTPA